MPLQRCIKGETCELSSFMCVANLAVDPPTPKSITITCPNDHSFTLEQAVEKGLCSEEDAIATLVLAKQTLGKAKEEYEEREKEGWRARSSDFVPNPKVVAERWICVKCKKNTAEWAAGNPPLQECALCLSCRADWSNYNGEALIILTNVSGRAYELGWNLLWQRFLRNDPPLNKEEAEALLQKHRKQARKESLQRSRLKRKKATKISAAPT